MRSYGSVPTCFWSNPEMQHLSDQAKLLATYLLTSPHTNMLGCFRLPDGYITVDLGWKVEIIKKIFHELQEPNFLTRDGKTGWLVVHDFLKWHPIKSVNLPFGKMTFVKVFVNYLVHMRRSSSFITRSSHAAHK
jgi:hypothetical protein